MINEPEYSVTESMTEQGLLHPVDTGTLDEFLAGDGLRLLFFAGPKSMRRESHDVAVALRELLRDYGPMVSAALIASDEEATLQERFRVNATPCLVFLIDGEVIELLPRVRDWADYAAAFQRYLGHPPAARKSA